MRPYSINTSNEQHKQLKILAIERETSIGQLIIDACAKAGYFEAGKESIMEVSEPYAGPSVPLTPNGAVDLADLRSQGKL